jgi:hypothetical protein
MRVLIAGHSLGPIGGVQVYERDLASWLLARGHAPIVYATELGGAARQMTQLTIPVTDDLRTITTSIDVIHGDSAIETMAALLHFQDTPAVFVCHGWGNVERTVPRFPRLRRYVAVDDTCADRLLVREGIPQESVSVILNGVDLRRFVQRAPLPAKPRRAVAFGNLAHDLTFLAVVRDACRRASIELDVIGEAAGTAVADPAAVLGEYDLAFAKAKCAMEAMASGLAVILCDAPGIGGMVRPEDFDRLRRLNFGIRTLSTRLSADAVLSEIAAYDPAAAREVSDRIRATASVDSVHESLLDVYATVIAENHATDRAAENRAAAAFLHSLAIRDRQREQRMWTLARASQRVFDLPLVGRVASPILSWLGKQKRRP